MSLIPTTRQLEVLRLLWEGLPQKAIAADLGISAKGVEDRIQRMFRKSNTDNRIGLCRWALEKGLLKV